MHVLMHLGMFYHVYTNLAALSDVNCLFSDVVYLGVQVAGFDAIFDCITNMIGRFFLFANCQVDATNQACKRLGFVIFILTFTSNVTFLLCSVNSSVKMTFCYFIAC